MVVRSDARLVATERAAAAARTSTLAAAALVWTSAAALAAAVIGRGQFNFLDSFGVHLVRLRNALFVGFPLRVEPPVAFKPTLTLRAWFCG